MQVEDNQRISSLSNNTIEKLRKVKHKVFKMCDRRRTFLDSKSKLKNDEWPPFKLNSKSSYKVSSSKNDSKSKQIALSSSLGTMRKKFNSRIAFQTHGEDALLQSNNSLLFNESWKVFEFMPSIDSKEMPKRSDILTEEKTIYHPVLNSKEEDNSESVNFMSKKQIAKILGTN